MRGLLKIAVPMVISSSALTIMQFTDRLFLGRYGELELQASLPAGVLSFTLGCFFAAVAGYASTLVAQYYGANERERCVKAAAQGAWWSLFVSPVCFLFPPLSEFILKVAKHSTELAAQETLYMSWMFACVPAQMLTWALSGYFSGRSRMTIVTATSIATCAVNIALDYALIFGRWGFPEWGLRGGAIATFASMFVAPFIYAAFIVADKEVRAAGLRKSLAFDKHIFGQLVRFGIPAGAQLFFDVSAFALFTLMAAELGGAALTASTAVLSINNLAFSPLMGISHSAAILCGQFKGANDFKETMRSGWAGLRLGWCYMALIAAVFLILPETLLSQFVPDNTDGFDFAGYYKTGKTLVLLITIWGFFDTASIITTGSLRGVGDTKFVMWYLGLMSWLLWIPGELLIFKHFGGGIIAGWIWMTIYIAILAAGFVHRWSRGKWFEIKVID